MPTPSRRDFLKMLAAGTAVGIVPPQAYLRLALAAQAVANSLPNGVAAGDVTPTSAVLWAHSTTPGTVLFEYTTVRGFIDFRAIFGGLTAEVTDPTIPVKVQVDGLMPGTVYYFRAVDASGARLQGRFRTPAAPGQKKGLHFGVSGDWRGEIRPYMGVANVAALELDFFMMHGDTIYADVPSLDFTGDQARTLAEFRVKHNEVYSTLDDRDVWAELRASTGVYVIHDDHEVTNDFAGGAPPSTDSRFDQTGDYINQTQLYQNGMQVFQEYNPLRDEVYSGTNDPRMEGRPKLYRHVTFGDDAAIYVLDARSFRDQEESQLPLSQVINPFAIRSNLAATFTPGRTMLGRTQVEDLKRDLLAAHQAGITWKFVMIPEPIQNMGWLGGVDRWEGYAPERTEVLKFIEDNAIRNVVFISADIHSTFINNVTYQTEAGGAPVPTHCFEITTGPVGYYPPTGQFIVQSAAERGLLPKARYDAYQTMSIPEKDQVVEDLVNTFVLSYQGFSRLGLDDSLVQWQRLKGGWALGHIFGWTEFEVDKDSQQLTITTWGVPAYDRPQVEADPAAILVLTPDMYSQLVITPQ